MVSNKSRWGGTGFVAMLALLGILSVARRAGPESFQIIVGDGVKIRTYSLPEIF